MIKGEKAIHTQAEIDLLTAFLKADGEGKCKMGGISQFINKRWKSFNNFKRNGRTGKLVMVGDAEAKVLQQARNLRHLHRIVDFVQKAGDGEDLPLADQLLIKIGVVELNLIAKRARDLGLLHAFGVRQLFLAELQHLAVIQTDGHGADEQHRAQDEP